MGAFEIQLLIDLFFLGSVIFFWKSKKKSEVDRYLYLNYFNTYTIIIFIIICFHLFFWMGGDAIIQSMVFLSLAFKKDAFDQINGMLFTVFGLFFFTALYKTATKFDPRKINN